MKTQNIPEVLKQKARWCVWKRNEENKKIPINPRTGKYGKSNDCSTFSDFETAAAVCSHGGYAGLGLGIFNGFSTIDIDHCIEDGKLSEMAQDIIKRIPVEMFANDGIYYSSSGNGTAGDNHHFCLCPKEDEFEAVEF